VPGPEIPEWVPVALMSLPGLLYLGLLMIGIAGLVASRRRRIPEIIVIFAVAAVLFLKIVTAFASPRHAKVPAVSGSSSRESSPGFRTGRKNTGPRAKGRSLLRDVGRHGTTRYSFSCRRTAYNLDWNGNDRTS
jgi:LPXTG-motif cell wall-anchored protein